MGRTIRGAAQITKSAINALTAVLTRFDVAHPYDDLGCLTDGAPLLFDQGRLTCGPPVNYWAIQKPGADNLYDVPPSKLKAIALALLGSSARVDCFLSPLVTPSIQVLLNIRKENGLCVAGTSYVFGTREPFIRGGTGDLEFTGPGTGVPDGRVHLDPPDATALAALQLTHLGHGSGTGKVCAGAGVTLDDPSTLPAMTTSSAAHLAFESTPYCQQDATYRRQCQVKRFTGFYDPAWTPTERCQIAILEHRFHTCWSEDGIKSGNQGLTRRCNTAHSFAHKCANLKDDFELRFPCHSKKGDMSSCPKMTCEAYLRQEFPDGGTTLRGGGQVR